MSSNKKGSVVDLRKKKVGAAIRSTVPIFFPAERKSPLRARRRRLRALSALLAIVLLAGALAGVSFASYSARYSINDISITGAKTVSSQLIRAYVDTKINDGVNHFLSRQNIFFYPRQKIKEGIAKEIPRVRYAEVYREGMLAQAITVKIIEREPFALWCPDLSCFVMDEGGFIFSKSSTSTLNLGQTFRGGIKSEKSPIGQTYLSEHFAKILELFKRLHEAGFAPMGGEAFESDDFTVSLAEGYLVRISLSSDLNALVRNLEIALTAEPLRGKADKLEYIDLRFGNRVYYKFK